MLESIEPSLISRDLEEVQHHLEGPNPKFYRTQRSTSISTPPENSDTESWFLDLEAANHTEAEIPTSQQGPWNPWIALEDLPCTLSNTLEVEESELLHESGLQQQPDRGLEADPPDANVAEENAGLFMENTLGPFPGNATIGSTDVMSMPMSLHEHPETELSELDEAFNQHEKENKFHHGK